MSQARIKEILQQMSDMKSPRGSGFSGGRKLKRCARGTRKKCVGKGIVGGCESPTATLFQKGGRAQTRKGQLKYPLKVAAAKSAAKQQGTWLYLLTQIYRVIKPYGFPYSQAMIAAKGVYPRYKSGKLSIQEILDAVDRQYGGALRKKCQGYLGKKSRAVEEEVPLERKKKRGSGVRARRIRRLSDPYY